MVEQQYDLITIGGATWDSTVTADQSRVLEEGQEKYLAFPYGKKVFMESFYFSFGGGAANVAVSASRLGLNVSFMGTIGCGELGDSIHKNFREQGVETVHAKLDRDHLASMSVILTAPDGERTILRFRGADEHLTAADVDWEHLKQTKWLYVASMAGDAEQLFDRIAEMAKADHITLAMNPGGTQIKRGPKSLQRALEHTAVLILNEEEARDLLRNHGKAGESLNDLLRALQEITRGTVVITRGAKGAVATDGQKHYDVPVVDSERVNTVGAGDAFGSTVVVSLIKNQPLETALAYAAVNAASVVADFTAQQALLDWDDLTKRASEAKLHVSVTDF
ncbi:carbohydrate kinase family protein [Patescibacteria group bacterium]|nr:carbohydrate kinase family protein [Patescibacteria group bacterium]